MKHHLPHALRLPAGRFRKAKAKEAWPGKKWEQEGGPKASVGPSSHLNPSRQIVLTNPYNSGAVHLASSPSMRTQETKIAAVKPGHVKPVPASCRSTRREGAKFRKSEPEASVTEPDIEPLERVLSGSSRIIHRWSGSDRSGLQFPGEFCTDPQLDYGAPRCSPGATGHCRMRNGSLFQPVSLSIQLLNQLGLAGTVRRRANSDTHGHPARTPRRLYERYSQKTSSDAIGHLYIISIPSIVSHVPKVPWLSISDFYLFFGGWSA